MSSQDDLVWLGGADMTRMAPAMSPLFRALCHDLRQPLAAIMVTASTMDVDLASSGQIHNGAERIQTQVSAMLEMINSVLFESAAPGLTSLGELLDDVVRTARTTYDGCLTFALAADAADIVISNEVSVRRAAANLVDNAIRAAGPDGIVHVSARQDGDRVEIVVDDDGPGFGAIKGGAGIGLSVVEAVAAQVGGKLSFAINSAGGVRAVLCLPSGLPRPELQAAS